MELILKSSVLERNFHVIAEITDDSLNVPNEDLIESLLLPMLLTAKAQYESRYLDSATGSVQ